MGVPRFYRWLSERYPKINQVISDTALLPEFDHLYLDMNGILHGCSHPPDKEDVTISEKDMIYAIFNYMDRIVTQIVKPKVSVFLAIDGVAPRAKLNQQRSRRFRAAKDLAAATATASRAETETGSSTASTHTHTHSDKFDSNCITPGTQFMTKISQAIQYYIRKKIQEDPYWRSLTIVFSGPEVPGEGEHKIMNFIREMKSSPNYPPNTRHVMYGQDADLIMLGLVTHEPHFTLLREVIDFNFHHSSSSTNALKAIQKFTKQSEFQLLHISILREYLFYEFAQLASSPTSSTSRLTATANTTTTDLERIIDDFVFLTFFVGNDFLPHTLDIADNAFELLFDTYRKQRPTWGQGQYLVDTGHISSPHRLENFLQEIGSHELSIMEEREKREADHRKKTDYRNRRNNNHNNNNKHSGNIKNNKHTPMITMQAEYAKQEEIKQANYFSMLSNISSFSETPTTNIHNNCADDETNNLFIEGRKDHKGRYYFEKLGLTPTDLSEHKALQKFYLEGLMWCLAYYYRGCISWGWYFPYHYGPMLSDLKGLSTYFTQITFELSEPLKPFQQLMGCLPPASATLVPPPYRNLMTSHSSPILHFYPTDFQIDMEGKRNPWEGINLLEFIDIQLLKDTLEHHCPDTLLTSEERARNTFGNVYIYTYDATATETIPSFHRNYFPDITQCHSHVAVVKSNHFQIDIPFRPMLVSGTVIPAPGYPSLKALPVTSVECLPLGLNCFGMPSKYSTMVLNLQELPPDLPSARLLADKILGKHVYINYPMMHEAKVVAISDKHGEVRLVINPNTTPKKKKISLMKKINNFSEAESDQWISESETLQEQYMRGIGIPGTGGLTIGPVRIRLSLKSLQGMKISPVDGSSKKIFGNEEADIPLQTALWQNPAPDPRFSERGPKRWKDLFPSGCRVLLTKGKYKGCAGTIITTLEEAEGEGDANKRVITQVQIIPSDPPFGLAIARSIQEAYLSISEVADVLKMNPRVIGKAFGTLLVEPGRYDLGLNLRYQSNFCVIGYTQYVLKGPKKNDTVQEKAAWTPGDAVRVIGSRKSTTLHAPAKDTVNSSGIEEGYWQYTPKAVQLLAMYRIKFPQLFTALAKYPNEKMYDAFQLFGPKGNDLLPKIREWLNGIETAAIPRTPTTTIAMSSPAIAAVQRASDVRSATVKAHPLQQVTLKLPPSAIFREGSKSATDVVALPDTSEPQLGDRIVNLCANGVPFGARGTVVAVHSSKNGCVEVVMDEEFIGGSNLQGSCQNFRGKLCLWAHLLKLSAADSTEDIEYVKSPITKKEEDEAKLSHGTSTAVTNLISANEKLPVSPSRSNDLLKHSKTPIVKVAVDGSKTPTDNVKADESKTPIVNVKVKSLKAPIDVKVEHSRASSDTVKVNRSKTPINDMDRSKTPTDSKKKQGAWKEAKGPQGGKGFNGLRRAAGGKNGYSAWNQYVKRMQQPQSTISTTSRFDDAIAGLKSVLGVTSSNSSSSALKPFAENLIPDKNTTTALDALRAIMVDESLGKASPLPMPGLVPKFNFTYTQEGSNDGSSISNEMEVFSLHQNYPSTIPYHPPMPIPTMSNSHPAVIGYHPMMPPSQSQTTVSYQYNQPTMEPNSSKKRNNGV